MLLSTVSARMKALNILDEDDEDTKETQVGIRALLVIFHLKQETIVII